MAENSRGLNFLLMSATLRGEVTDPNGEAVSDAAVTLINLRTNKKLAVKSDKKGNYQFVVSDFGSYRLRVEAKYFRSFEEELVLHLSDDLRRDVWLDVGAMVGVIVIEKPRESGFNVNDVHVRVN